MTLAYCAVNRDVAACIGVMILESDPTTEMLVAEALTAVQGHSSPSAQAVIAAIQTRHKDLKAAEVLGRLAWRFWEHFRSERTMTVETSDVGTDDLHEVRTHGLLGLANQIEQGHEELLTAITRTRAVVDDLEAARPVDRNEALAALESALRSATRIRAGLADAALAAPELGEQATSAAHLASVVARAADTLRSLATPSGRSTLERLAQELATGTVETKNPVRRAANERARVAAAEEAAAGLARPADELAAFVGPPDGASWLEWFWTLAGTAEEESLQVAAALENTWSQIHHFISSVGAEDWAPGYRGSQDEQSPEATSDQAEVATEPAATVAPLVPSLRSPSIDAASASPSDSKADGDAMTDAAPESLSPPLQPPASAISTTVSVKGAADHSREPREAVTDSPIPRRTSDTPSAPADAESADRPQRATLRTTTFDEYARTHWVSATGEVLPAPWNQGDFVRDAFSTLATYLREDNWSLALLVSRGLSQLAAPGAPRTEDMNRAFEFRAKRWSRSDEEKVALANALRHLLDKGEGIDDLAHRLQIAVAFTAPDVPQMLAEEEVEDLTTLAGFSDRVRAFLVEWVRVARRHHEPFELLRRQLRADQGASLGDLQAAEERAADELKQRLRQLQMAAGNKVQRTHCRAGWDEFFAVARPVFDQVLLSPRDPQVRASVGRLSKRAAKIFDRHEAKFNDRSVMDRAVDQLVDGANAFFAAAESTHAATSSAESPDTFRQAVIELMTPAAIAEIDEDDAWIVTLFRAAVFRGSAQPTKTIDRAVIEGRPWMLSAWPPNAQASEVADVSQCIQPLLGLAHLLRTNALPPFPGGVREWVFEHAPVLLAHFPDINDRERGAAEGFSRRCRDQLDTVLAKLRGHHLELAELADHDAHAVVEAMKAIEEAASGAFQDPLLVGAWARSTENLVAGHRNATLARVVEQARAAGEISEEDATELIARRRFADFHLRGRSNRTVGLATRATLFRAQAESQWKEPRHALSALSSDASSPEPLRRLVHDWCRAARTPSPLGHEKQMDLRERFVEVVFDQTQSRRKKRIASTKVIHRISCTDLATWLPNSAETPTFLPQLHRFSDLHIVALPAAPGDRALPTKLIALGEGGAITVVLAPGLSPQVRDDVRRGLRSAPGKRVAIIDDLDLCRLLNPGGAQPPLVEALVELVFEQQRWSDFAPFEVQEGQHVRMEMYVGRRTEAERLAVGTSYSRIFSGRRLGKTALLRYVEHRYGGKPLPSGNILRVLYVPIVGHASEHDVVDEIVDKLQAVAGIQVEKENTPRATLERAIAKAIGARPDESYLIFLDEADTFFENQTRAEGASRESAISWTMRNLEGIQKDERGLPRVRFVVCGYRATNRSEGAWGNWGDVLLLSPLEPMDAVPLVTGPLARLGIDVRDQADAIAFRCGYQPAVIIHFCARLLDALEHDTPYTDRDRRIVHSQDVVSVFQLPEVQDRVRETAWLNFVGDPVGQLTFASFLAEAASLAPGTPIDDAPQRILRHILSESQGRTLAEIGGGSWQDVGARHLRDLVKRSLLVEAEHHPLSLRLRFPHQLPILLQESPLVRIRDSLDLLAAGHGAGAQRAEWVVPDDVLENVRWMLSSEAYEFGVRRVVLGTLWCDPLLEKRGLAQRLPEVQLIRQVATSKDLDEVTDKARVLVGGVDLLRLALRRHYEGDSSIEVPRIGRLSMDAIKSYFKRTRSVEFAMPGALPRIVGVTSGIPLLVGQFARGYRDEATVNEAQLGEGLSAVSEAFPALARELVSGTGSSRLDDREQALLYAIVAASRFDAEAVADIVTDAELLEEAVALDPAFADRDITPLGADDNTRVALLLNLGLLPRRVLEASPGKLISEVDIIPQDDAIHTLVDQMLGIPRT